MYNWELIRRQSQAILDSFCHNDQECGCQLAIYHHGDVVLDIVSGTTLPGGKGQKITSDALFPVFSCGKALLATAVLQSVDRGTISLDTPLAEFWKEFAVDGKAQITVEHVLSHRAGMYILPKTNSIEELADWELMCRKTAGMTPRNAPGERCCYHPLTFAWLAGNILVLTENQPLSKILSQRILKPCGIENEFFFGMDEISDRRFVPVDDTMMEPKPSWYNTMIANTTLRHACIPSYNGCGSARAMARFYAALTGELPGVELLSAELLSLATERVWRSPQDKLPDNAWYHFGLGMLLTGPLYKRNRIFGHGGAAGAEGFFDRDTGLAIGFTKNRPLPSHPQHPVRNQLSELLNIPARIW